jgi:hypothetical protein
MKTGFKILLIFTALILQGCYPMDDASTRALKVNSNFYEKNPFYPEYLQAIYLVEVPVYHKEQDKDFFIKSIECLRRDSNSSYPPLDELPQMRFVLFVIKNQKEHLGESSFASSHKAAILLKLEDVLNPKIPVFSLIHQPTIEHDFELFYGKNENCLMIKRDAEQRKQRGEHVIEKQNWRDEHLSKEDRELIKKLQENNK